jgi:hypothetical protein
LTSFLEDIKFEVPNYPVSHPPVVIDDRLYIFVNTEDANTTINEIKILHTERSRIYAWFYLRLQRVTFYTRPLSDQEVVGYKIETRFIFVVELLGTCSILSRAYLSTMKITRPKSSGRFEHSDSLQALLFFFVVVFLAFVDNLKANINK